MPTNRQIIKPNSIPKLTVTQKVFLRESGTVSVNIQFVQFTRAPDAKPNNNLPKHISMTLIYTIYIPDDIITSKASHRALNHLPLLTNLPDNREPKTSPRIPQDDMIVL